MAGPLGLTAYAAQGTQLCATSRNSARRGRSHCTCAAVAEPPPRLARAALSSSDGGCSMDSSASNGGMFCIWPRFEAMHQSSGFGRAAQVPYCATDTGHGQCMLTEALRMFISTERRAHGICSHLSIHCVHLHAHSTCAASCSCRLRSQLSSARRQPLKLWQASLPTDQCPRKTGMTSTWPSAGGTKACDCEDAGLFDPRTGSQNCSFAACIGTWQLGIAFDSWLSWCSRHKLCP